MNGICNFRDLGGGVTESGRAVRTGLLYRSGSLAHASDADWRQVAGCGIRTLCDLRTLRERSTEPALLPENHGLRELHIPVKVKCHDERGLLPRMFSLLFGGARKVDYFRVACDMYREYVTDFCCEFSQLLQVASDRHNLPLLIHCTGGKDRTGFGCAVIQLALGMPRERVFQDYLASKECLAEFKVELHRKLGAAARFGVSLERFLPLIETHREYLESALEQIGQSYGGFQEYLRRGLSFPDKDQARLQSLLLAPAER